ncbi:head-tail connector protein [Clostridium botulinum]|uniref:head-tail connector protein n=1 Tax=Clostridium botulinum TaxID=1491 RepID=UPI00099D8850|nr:head-tail connector protein [Clostridium botulinum]OPD21411.1 DNA packaging protein [Clostridium botulinum]
MILQEIKDYLKIDDDYEDNSLNELIVTSEIYIDSMVGEGYKTDNKALRLANLLQKKLIADMYENRSTEIPTNTKQDRIVTSILDKLSNFEV